MIGWILTRMEESPNAVFYGRELKRRFPESLDQSIKDKLLCRIPSALNSYSDGLSSPYLIEETDEGLEALNEDDPEAEPISLSGDDLVRYKLDLDAFATRIQKTNNLIGKPSPLTDRLFFMGEADAENALIAYVLALINSAPSVQHVLDGLPGLLSRKYQGILVVCPTYVPVPNDRRHLEDLGIRVTILQSDYVLAPYCDLFQPAITGSDFKPSNDYRTIIWNSKFYTLTPEQAAVVSMLHQTYRMGSQGLTWIQIQNRLNILDMFPQRLRDVFQGSPVWRKLVISTARGIYRLDL